MSVWLVVVACSFAVGVPLSAGWWWSERLHRRRAAGLCRGLAEREEALEVLRSELARASVKASGLAASIRPNSRVERRVDLVSSLSLVHEAMRARELELGALRRRYRMAARELAESRTRAEQLEGEGSRRLADDQAFQLHLAQVTDERDRLLAVFKKDPGFRAQRLQLKAAKRELEELRMKLRAANAAIMQLERERAEELSLLDDLFEPLPEEPLASTEIQ